MDKFLNLAQTHTKGEIYHQLGISQSSIRSWFQEYRPELFETLFKGRKPYKKNKKEKTRDYSGQLEMQAPAPLPSPQRPKPQMVILKHEPISESSLDLVRSLVANCESILKTVRQALEA
jgi:hypothetical protein